MRRTAEPEPMSDIVTNGHTSRGARDPERQLFDHRRDDPMRFSALSRPQQQQQQRPSSSNRPAPTSQSSGEYISASSSYAASQISSTFTLSSNTDGSSTSSALFDRQGRQPDEGSGSGSNNIFALQLKKLYRLITALEKKVQMEDGNSNEDDQEGRDTNRIQLMGKNTQSGDEESDKEKDKWVQRIEDHKKLVETIQNLLDISLAPTVPASLRNIPIKYNIIVRLWTFGFHKLLETLRRASFNSPLAMEHLQGFIYYAYSFYTALLESPPLEQFRSGWLEALGDLARYRMMVSAMTKNGSGPSSPSSSPNVTEAAASSDAAPDNLAVPAAADATSVSNAPAARIDDSPSPSVGVAAARALELEPETDRWRTIAREWYGKGLTEQPGTGRLHQDLGLLSRDVPGEELRTVYHFVKSMTTLHPFPLSREYILSTWSPDAQSRRQGPDARASDLFVLLHGMIFTNIQLDDFRPTLFRFIEQLSIEGAEDREWIMMGVVNICAILEYNKPNSILKQRGGIVSRDTTKKEEEMEVDADAEPSMGFKLALELTFGMLSHALRHPARKASPYARTRLNPYISIILTFLATMLKHEKTLELMERSVPWEELAKFFASIPRNIMSSQNLFGDQYVPCAPDDDRWIMLTTGCAPPLPEDWCMRGMEWVGRKVFERGYWKYDSDRQAEMEVLDSQEEEEMSDGRIEDDREDDPNTIEKKKRWVRIARCAVNLAGVIKGFNWVEGTREWRVEGELAEKAQRWKELDLVEKEEEERRKMGTRWADDDSMDVDEDAIEASESSSDDDNDSDLPEIKELKARRRYLRSLLQSAPQVPRRPSRSSRRETASQPLLPIVAGYTVLVIDTNLLLSSLSMFSSLVETMRWTVLVPLPVIMELDGLKGNSSTQLSEAADRALSYITSHLKSHGLSLKVQTSKGNYLTSLNVRTEDVEFNRSERTMDDLILKTAIWHDEHWVDRSAMLKSERESLVPNAVKVVLLSLDRNLRLKSRSRQLPAASEKDLAIILSNGT